MQIKIQITILMAKLTKTEQGSDEVGWELCGIASWL
jgi:hypothetical protein